MPTLEHVGPTYQYYWTSRDAVFNARFDEVVVDLRFAGVTERPVVFVYSHTHLSHTGFSPVAGSSTPTFVNTGAWQRTIYPAHLQELEELRAHRGGTFCGAFGRRIWHRATALSGWSRTTTRPVQLFGIGVEGTTGSGRSSRPLAVGFVLDELGCPSPR